MSEQRCWNPGLQAIRPQSTRVFCLTRQMAFTRASGNVFYTWWVKKTNFSSFDCPITAKISMLISHRWRTHQAFVAHIHPSKAIWSIVDSGGHHPMVSHWDSVEDTDTQEAQDDITECLHDLIRDRLSMWTFAFAWCKRSEALGPWNPAAPANRSK